MSINEMVAAYMEETENEKRAKKAAAALKESIMAYMAGNKSLVTDEFSVILKETKSRRLDNEKLYAEFGKKETLELFGKDSVSVSIIVSELANTETKSA